jgi:hypothetical protein
MQDLIATFKRVAVLTGCRPYDAGDKPYAVDEYQTSPAAVYDYARPPAPSASLLPLRVVLVAGRSYERTGSRLRSGVRRAVP